MTRVLAIDQGTTSTRAVAVDVHGGTETVATRVHRQIYPRPGWVEHDPLELLAHVSESVGAADASIVAVGIDNQGESCLAWDRRTGQPASPVLVWQDERTAPETARLRAEGAESLTLARAGLPLDPYFSASKLGWIVREVPEAQDLARSGRLCLGTTDAFFRHRLTGRFETDIATASRTALMDLDTCRWNSELCALFGVPGDCLPEITATTGELGTLSERDLPLSASIVDQQAALRGHGCARTGDAKITFGTGAFALALAGTGRPASRAAGPLPTVAWTGPGGKPLYALDGGVHTAAAALNWARDLGLFADWSEIADFDRTPAVSRGLVFVPALAGLACPHWDRGAKGAWFGMTLDSDRRDLVQAVLEGIAFRAAEVVASIEAELPIAPRISIDGGLTRNPWFCRFLASCLRREIFVSADAELTALGTATLAAEAVGVRIDRVPEGEVLEPQVQPDGWAEAFSTARRLVQHYGAETRR